MLSSLTTLVIYWYNTYPTLSTAVSLGFGDTIPTNIDGANIWRWYDMSTAAPLGFGCHDAAYNNGYNDRKADDPPYNGSSYCRRTEMEE